MYYFQLHDKVDDIVIRIVLGLIALSLLIFAGVCIFKG